MLSSLRKASFVLALSFIALYAGAQNVAKVNGKPITSKEFMWVYKKNHANVAKVNYQDLAAYLDLYINYKLKVADARAMELDKDTTYLNEVAGYEKALSNQKKVSPKSAEYSYIIQEYQEGVLMFNASERKVWNKVQDDEADLLKFYNQNKADYGGKGFEEVRGQVVSAYQQSLENDWINSLKTKYSVKINTAELKKLAKL